MKPCMVCGRTSVTVTPKPGPLFDDVWRCAVCKSSGTFSDKRLTYKDLIQ
jgi:ubiquitin C-terminal hydrolase